MGILAYRKFQCLFLPLMKLRRWWRIIHLKPCQNTYSLIQAIRSVLVRWQYYSQVTTKDEYGCRLLLHSLIVCSMNFMPPPQLVTLALYAPINAYHGPFIGSKWRCEYKIMWQSVIPVHTTNPGPYLHLASSNLTIPEHICFNIYMDFIEGLPTSHRKLVISVVVDRLSKYAHLVAPSNPYTVASIAQVFDKKITRLHGMPKSIMS